MPLFMHEHDVPGAKAEDVAREHAEDLRVQGKYGVEYRHYWLDEKAGKVYCLVEAPDAETAAKVHLEAHGGVADRTYEVTEG